MDCSPLRARWKSIKNKAIKLRAYQPSVSANLHELSHNQFIKLTLSEWIPRVFYSKEIKSYKTTKYDWSNIKHPDIDTDKEMCTSDCYRRTSSLCSKIRESWRNNYKSMTQLITIWRLVHPNEQPHQVRRGACVRDLRMIRVKLSNKRDKTRENATRMLSDSDLTPPARAGAQVLRSSRESCMSIFREHGGMHAMLAW